MTPNHTPTTQDEDLYLNIYPLPRIADILKPLIRLGTWVTCGNIPVGRIPETIVIGASWAKSDFKRTGDIMKAEICHCFIDANTFLHYRSFTEVDWCEELGANRVILVVCLAVVRALDEKKLSGSNSKIRKRARKIISKLRELGNVKKQVEIRPNVGLLFAVREPDIKWKVEGLSPDLPDDRIVATVLKESVDKDNVVLLTADLGLQLKAESKGIRCHTLPDNLQLKPKRSPEEEELVKLREKLSRLENRLPVLSVKLVSEDGINSFGRFRLRKMPGLSSANIDSRVAEISKKLQYFSTDKNKKGSLASLILSYVQPSQEEIDRYGKDVERYIEEMRNYLKKEWEYRDVRSRTIELRFALVNEGTGSAEEVDIFLYFRDGFEICNASNLPKEPTPPDEPVPPRSVEEMLVDLRKIDFSYLPNLPRIPSTIVTPQFREDIPQGPRIKKIKSYEVAFSTPKLKHGFLIKFDPVYVIFPSIETGKSFNVNYSILAGNLPEKIEGEVHIIIDTEGCNG